SRRVQRSDHGLFDRLSSLGHPGVPGSPGGLGLSSSPSSGCPLFPPRLPLRFLSGLRLHLPNTGRPARLAPAVPAPGLTVLPTGHRSPPEVLGRSLVRTLAALPPDLSCLLWGEGRHGLRTRGRQRRLVHVLGLRRGRVHG